MELHEYNVSLTWTEGRKGIIGSPELKDALEVATPPQFENGISDIWSPEHLLTAAVSSCFMTTFLAIADYSKLEYLSFECDAVGVLGKPDGRYAMTEIILKPKIELANEMDREKAIKIMIKAEAACLITRSIKTPVRLELETYA
jgi:peroxiredoxin-like protein